MALFFINRNIFLIAILFIIFFINSDARWFPELTSDKENSKSNPLTITDDDIHAQVAAPRIYQQADGILLPRLFLTYCFPTFQMILTSPLYDYMKWFNISQEYNIIKMYTKVYILDFVVLKPKTSTTPQRNLY